MRYQDVNLRPRGWLALLLVIAVLLSACQTAATPVAVEPRPRRPASLRATRRLVRPLKRPRPRRLGLPRSRVQSRPRPHRRPPDAGSHGHPRADRHLGADGCGQAESIKDTENFLVLGMDQRPGERGWRTDTIIVVAIDYEANQVGLLSIPATCG